LDHLNDHVRKIDSTSLDLLESERNATSLFLCEPASICISLYKSAAFSNGVRTTAYRANCSTSTSNRLSFFVEVEYEGSGLKEKGVFEINTFVRYTSSECEGIEARLVLGRFRYQKPPCCDRDIGFMYKSAEFFEAVPLSTLDDFAHADIRSGNLKLDNKRSYWTSGSKFLSEEYDQYDGYGSFAFGLEALHRNLVAVKDDDFLCSEKGASKSHSRSTYFIPYNFSSNLMY